MKNILSVLALLACTCCQTGLAQSAQAMPSADFTRDNESLRATYRLGTGDVIFVRVPVAEEIDGRPYKVESDGFVSLPVLGRMRASGLTVETFERDLRTGLQQFYREPAVTASIVQFRSEPVFFVGAFRMPGMHPLQDRRRLLEFVTINGGLLPNASRRLRVTRKLMYGTIPLPEAVTDEQRGTSSVDIAITDLMEAGRPDDNLLLQPFDVVTALRTEMVYVTGEVGKIGGYELNDREWIVITQLLSLAGGPARDADLSKARILRPVLDTTRRAEIPVDIRKIMRGQAVDNRLLPNDILVIPGRSGLRRTSSQILLFSAPGLISTLVLLGIR